MAKKNDAAVDAAQQAAAALKELRAIRSLLMLLALKIGATATEVGVALGVSKQRVAQLIAASEIKKLSFGKDEEK